MPNSNDYQNYIEYYQDLSPNILIGRQTQNEMTSSKVKRLKSEIKVANYNINTPIEVGKIEGKFIIIDGHHRVKAARELGLKKIPIIVKLIEDKSIANSLIMQAAEAMQSYNLH